MRHALLHTPILQPPPFPLETPPGVAEGSLEEPFWTQFPPPRPSWASTAKTTPRPGFSSKSPDLPPTSLCRTWGRSNNSMSTPAGVLIHCLRHLRVSLLTTLHYGSFSALSNFSLKSTHATPNDHLSTPAGVLSDCHNHSSATPTHQSIPSPVVHPSSGC